MLDFAVKPVGDCALSAEFAEEISVRVNQQVHALDELLRAAAIPGVVETVPTYRTLIIHYRPEVISYQALRDRVLRERGQPVSGGGAGSRVIELPVLYGGEVELEPDAPRYDGWDGRETAPDLEAVLAFEHISWEEFIRRHTQNLCYVYFQAFAIGHSYVGNPEKSFTVPRAGGAPHQDPPGVHRHLGGPDGAQRLRPALRVAGHRPHAGAPLRHPPGARLLLPVRTVGPVCAHRPAGVRPHPEAGPGRPVPARHL